MKPYAFGVDLGGNAIKIGLFQTTGNLVEKWTIPTRLEDHGSHLLSDVVDAIRARDPQAAYDAMWQHLVDNKRSIEAIPDDV